MKTRIIHTRIWSDDYFSKLALEEKLVFIYLLTNNKINICGAYELSHKYIIFETGITKDKWEKIKAKFEKDNKFLFYKSWIYAVNAEKYNNYRSNKKLEKAYNKEVALLPDGARRKFGLEFTMDDFREKKYKMCGKGYQHRVLVEKVLGRSLEDNEIVHHLDKNPENDNVENLAVMTKREHKLLHRGKIDPEDTSMILVSDYYDTSINNKSKIINNKEQIRKKKSETRKSESEEGSC